MRWWFSVIGANGRALRWWGNQGLNVQFLNKSLIKVQMMSFARQPHYCKTSCYVPLISVRWDTTQN